MFDSYQKSHISQEPIADFKSVWIMLKLKQVIQKPISRRKTLNQD